MLGIYDLPYLTASPKQPTVDDYMAHMEHALKVAGEDNIGNWQRRWRDFKATIAQQQKQIEALTATVQKVSEQIALSKPAPQLVANSQ